MGADAHSFAFMCFIWIGTIIGSHATGFLRMLMIWQKLINKTNLEPHGMDGGGEDGENMLIHPDIGFGA